MKNVLFPACNALVAGLCLVGLPAAAQSLQPVLREGEEATRRAEQVQEQINQLDDEVTDLEGDYRSNLQSLDAAKLFILQQEQVIANQETELESLEEQLATIDDITAQMTPMLIDMVLNLETFITNDLPFKMDERTARLEQLQTALTSPDVAPPEQYRLIVEAYQAEMEYGRTIDTYNDKIVVDGSEVEVEMFQYGRVALVYYNSANGDVARWDREAGAWEQLDGKYRRPIQDAIRIAEKTKTPDVLYGPVTKYVAPELDYVWSDPEAVPSAPAQPAAEPAETEETESES